MMTDLFDTDDLSDLTDAHIQEMLEVSGTLWKVAQIRRYPEEYAAEIALARLMRDHPGLFEKPVDPIEEEARRIVEEHYPAVKDTYNGRRLSIAVAAIKRGMELAKGGEA